jgi:hypothetical protein
MLQAGRSRVRFQMRSLDFLNLPNPSSRTILTGVDSASKRNEYQESSLGGKVRSAREAENLTALCEQIV